MLRTVRDIQKHLEHLPADMPVETFYESEDAYFDIDNIKPDFFCTDCGEWHEFHEDENGNETRSKTLERRLKITISN